MIFSSVEPGLDVFLKKKAGRWQGHRCGLIVHQASVTRSLRHAIDALNALPGFRLAALLAPEHGLSGTAQDQVAVGPSRHAGTGLPVFSLYGRSREDLVPSAEALSLVDFLLFDLQDVGVRYYTFVWTMVLAMKAAAEKGIPFVVLDRPNPLGGETVEGNLLEPAFASFVGLHPVPVRHGLTAGELALHLNASAGIGCELEVVAMKGWKRRMWFDETGLPWVMPSPNMPTLDTAAVYAGMCLLEATNLSEGRGTTRPFEIVGAPFVDGPALARELAKEGLPGVAFRPCSFQPTFNKWAGETCQGVQLHVTDRKAFRSYRTGLSLLQAVRRLHPRDFRWKQPPYEYETEKLPIDVLCGTDRVRKALEAGAAPAELEKSWQDELSRFRSDRLLLY
jgi:uncharacterized protein YbbC (DUF1343 family)